MTAALGRIVSQKEMFIMDERGSLTAREISSQARRMVSRHGVKLIAIDYLQLVASGQKHSNRHEEVAYVSHTLKATAKELGIPLLLISQLSRSAVRDGMGPKLSDLRESGACEEDADIVGLLDRDGEDDFSNTKTSKIKLLIAKSRNGPNGVVRFTFLKEFVRFELQAAEEPASGPETSRATRTTTDWTAQGQLDVG